MFILLFFSEKILHFLSTFSAVEIFLRCSVPCPYVSPLPASLSLRLFICPLKVCPFFIFPLQCVVGGDFHVLIFLEKVGRVVTCDEFCSVTL